MFTQISQPSPRQIWKIHWDNQLLIALNGDLNAESKNWYYHDKFSHGGNAHGDVTVQFGLGYIISPFRTVRGGRGWRTHLKGLKNLRTYQILHQLDLTWHSGQTLVYTLHCIQLSSSDSFYKIELSCCISTTSFTWDLALQRSKKRAY